MLDKRWIVVVLIVGGLAALLIWTGPDRSPESSAVEGEPAEVEPIKGTDLSRVRLSADAAKRLGIQTAPVDRSGGRRTVIPYSAVLYGAEGQTFTYTSPKPLVFVRHPIDVNNVTGGRAFLSRGPPAGTAVVTVGSQELYGTEYEVEED